jgi:uncharacterized glyoxalase superfamily protein PhnB
MGYLSSASIQVFASDLARTTAFYRLLGLPVAEPAAEVDRLEVELPGGSILSFDREQTISDMHPGWTPDQAGGRLALAFHVTTAAEADELFAAMTGAGYDGPLPPYDAPWGQRYATLADPDGVWVDLAGPLTENP